MIYVVVALSAEARPLIGHLGLQRVSELEPLSVFQRPDLALIVGGVGKIAAAAAVDALAKALPPEEVSVWLNLGVAGHRSYPLGTAVLANKVVDGDSGREWMPVVPSDLHIELGTVRSVEKVETDFESDDLYEMEAAGFYHQVSQLAPNELVQVLKIVSDNLETGTLCVSAHRVQELIAQSLPEIDRLLSCLHRRARQWSADQSSDQSPTEKTDSVS